MNNKSTKSAGLGGLIESLGNLIGSVSTLSQHNEAKDSGSHSGESPSGSPQGKLGQILEGLSTIAEKLQEASERGETVGKSTEFTWKAGDKDVKGVYGFSIRSGLSEGREQVKVEPFGNVRRDRKTGKAVVQEIREPLVDVFEEETHTLLVAELPGIGASDVEIDVHDDIVTLQASKGDKKYRKEVLLKHATTKEKVTCTANNGIVQIRCSK